MQPEQSNEQLRLVVVGHVDHGKSTVIGRLLADSNSLPEGKLEEVRKLCAQTSKPFEYAFLLDALRDERDQGITIDAARIFFRSSKRNYIILDAPGHIEFVRNMASGASQADAAVLVIDAEEGVQENSKRHGHLLSILGVKNLIVVINKCDLVGYEEAAYIELERSFTAYLSELDIKPLHVIPVSGREGDNIAIRSTNMAWYEGLSLLEALDAVPSAASLKQLPLRLPIQDVYKFTNFNDTRRIVAGRVESGTIASGDEVLFLPSGKKSRVLNIESSPNEVVEPGNCIGITLEDKLYLSRGDVVSKIGETPPRVASSVEANVFWLGATPLQLGQNYTFKIHTDEVSGQLEQIHCLIDSQNLERQSAHGVVPQNSVAKCRIAFQTPVAFDPASSIAALGRFVIVDDYRICGGGIIESEVESKQTELSRSGVTRAIKWAEGKVSTRERAQRFNQRPTLLLITGEQQLDRKHLARELEAELFAEGKQPFFLGIGSVLYGLDSDIKGDPEAGEEHFRRIAEVIHILLNAGLIVLFTASELSEKDMQILRALSYPEWIETIWLGSKVTTDIKYDLQIQSETPTEQAVAQIKEYMQDRGIILRLG